MNVPGTFQYLVHHGRLLQAHHAPLMVCSARSIYKVTTKSYGSALVNIMINKLIKSKSTLACGQSVGYNTESIYN